MTDCVPHNVKSRARTRSRFCRVVLLLLCLVLALLSGALGTRGSTTQPASRPSGVDAAPVAGLDDVRVGVIVDPHGAETKLNDPGERVVVYVVNVSDGPVRVHRQSLVGPIFEQRGKGVQGYPLALRSPPLGADRDLVVLQPGEVFGRSHVLTKGAAADVKASAYYDVFDLGFQGHRSHLVGRVSSKGIEGER